MLSEAQSYCYGNYHLGISKGFLDRVSQEKKMNLKEIWMLRNVFFLYLRQTKDSSLGSALLPSSRCSPAEELESPKKPFLATNNVSANHFCFVTKEDD